MLLRKPVSLWISVSLFALAVAIIPLTGQLRHQPDPPPNTLTELTALLSQKVPSLYVVPVIESKPEYGIYLCTQPQRRERLAWLVRNPQVIGTSHLGKWEGVVFCENVGNVGMIEENELQSWGEHGMQLGPIQYFGDPALLRRIQNAISELSKKRI